MGFLGVAVLFFLFIAGLVLAIQGFVGKEIYPDGRPFSMVFDPDHPGIHHPPERHRVRLLLIGLGLMASAVVIGIITL